MGTTTNAQKPGRAAAHLETQVPLGQSGACLPLPAATLPCSLVASAKHALESCSQLHRMSQPPWGPLSAWKVAQTVKELTFQMASTYSPLRWAGADSHFLQALTYEGKGPARERQAGVATGISNFSPLRGLEEGRHNSKVYRRGMKDPWVCQSILLLETQALTMDKTHSPQSLGGKDPRPIWLAFQGQCCPSPGGYLLASPVR